MRRRQELHSLRALVAPLSFILAGCGGSRATTSASDASFEASLDAPAAAQLDAPAVSPTDDVGCTSTQTISASSFDQSCLSDLDCVAVGQGSVCSECGFACPSAAINKAALAAYQAAVASSPAGSARGVCNCPSYGNPCCLDGQCSETCNDTVVNVASCQESGGTCVPYDSLLDGGPPCTRLSYCAADPSNPGSSLDVCCPPPPPDGGYPHTSPDGGPLPCPPAPRANMACTPGQSCSFALGAPACGDGCTCSDAGYWSDCMILCGM